ncbi:MAG: thioredoxin domain-containing protein [Acidobacteria bacterium 13_1_20CM_3_53_8]|nr:MAG: thioredoxin domain-containing protein [Acidobacteria bacterium 13_1_20CM_3_53_8]
MTEQKFTNRLINETSPYLLQHARNPVDWYAWGEEAFAKARQEDKPILLSIGYSACHWCHVMEHESFENEEIARAMNENFVSIKVDREERPDLDQIYMNAVQMMTGHGGWPMTVFLTPEGVPFYGGTYYPPEDRYNMPGFPRILTAIAEAYRERPDEVTQTAVSMLGELRRMGLVQESSSSLSFDLLDAAFRGIARSYDATNGGFGGAPKFPAPMNMEFLLRTFYRTRNEQALSMVEHTCRRMAEGGVYDQLGGGFHRYSTDARWLVPHFEKMLYDNALLSQLYLHLYQLTKDDFYRRVVEETLDYVRREMTDAGGGFYSTQDADSEGHEGKFFLWSLDEIKEILGEEDARLFSAYYDVSEGGNFEGKNILNVRRSPEAVASSLNVSVELLSAALERGRRKLFTAREKRIKPGRDEKILTAWNGLMLASFAEAAAVLERDDYRSVAENNARFVLDNLRRDSLLLRSYKDGQAKLNGYLEDYAFFADGLITLYETTGDLLWLTEALSITNKMIEEFWDEEEGGFYYTGKSHEELIVRTKDYFDNATPSGNSVAADVLLRLATLSGDEDYSRRAVTIFRLLADTVKRHPSAFGRLLCALDFYLSTPKEIVLIGSYDAEETRELRLEVWGRYLPNKVVVMAEEAGDKISQLVPLLRDRVMINSRPTAYVCQHYACNQPVTTREELSQQL